MYTILAYLENGDILGLLLYLLLMFLAMCIAISFHEWAHAFVAYKLGDPTAKNLGRMTLDPTKHLDPFGMISFLLFNIGWAKPVMVNSRNLKHFRRDDVLISIAGPLTNLVLSFIFFGALFFAAYFEANEYLILALEYIFTLNVSFAVFNILPIPPLDGFHVLTSIFVKRRYKVIEILERFGFIILIVLCVSGLLTGILSSVVGWLTNLYWDFFMLFV